MQCNAWELAPIVAVVIYKVMKTISNYNHATIKRILATFTELKFEKSQSIKVINQQRIAKQILKKL